MNALPKFVRPAVPAGTHPIETGRYVLPTPPVYNMLKTVTQWIDNRAPGGMIEGMQRFGKTSAIVYVKRRLPEFFGGRLPVLEFSCRDYRIASEGTFFEDLLRSFGHALYKSGKPAAKRDRLTEYLHEMVKASGQNRLVIFADEAQKLHEIQFRWLVDLYNDLDRLGVNTTVLLVGQPDLVHLRSTFETAGKMQIVGRFMVHHHHFGGLRNARDIKVCLNGYDEGSEHPEGSGWPYSRYYFPAAYASGWRLAQEADVLWAVFQEVRAEERLPGKAEIPMQYFSRSVEYILRRFGNLEQTSPQISKKIWKQAIESSGYHDAARYVVATHPNLTDNSPEAANHD